MNFGDLMQLAVHAFELAGVVVMIGGSVMVLVVAARRTLRGDRAGTYEAARQGIGRSILMGLEILIIADIIQTVTLEPTLDSALFLGVIVLVRTFLSFSLDVELTGRWPWHMADANARAVPAVVLGDDAPTGR